VNRKVLAFCTVVAVSWILSSTEALAQSQTAGGGASPVINGMTIEQLQKELKLTDEQKTRLVQLAMVRSGNHEATEKRLTVILKPEQLERLKQIQMQFDTASAIVKADVAKELGLTAEQRSKIAAVSKQTKEKALKELRGAKGAKGAAKAGDQKAKFAEAQEKVRKEINEKVIEILTQEQRAKFEKMQGEKIESDGSNP
jgi:Spy/CpxP family protein refolding chaperone